MKKNYQIANVPYSDPYWLRDQWSLGMYKVDDQRLIGKPETPRRLQVEFVLNINEYDITITKDVIRRYSQRDKGELYDPFEVLPRATTRIKEKVLLFPDNTPKTVAVAVRAGANRIKRNLSLEALRVG